MLKTLSIRNVLLIDSLDLSFSSGLGVLTGETGAGKSILLDALSLALGARASPNLVRSGENQASVTADFDLPLKSPIYQVLKDLDLSIEGSELLLRRVITAEGKSRSFVNDQPVSLTLLKALGDSLIEIHGQFDQLLNPSIHRKYLDHFGQLTSLHEEVQTAFIQYHDQQKKLDQAKTELADCESRKIFLKQALQDFKELNPKLGEEEELLKEKDYFQHYTKIVEAAETAQILLSGDKGAESLLIQAHRALEKVADVASTLYNEPVAALDRVLIEIQEVQSFLTLNRRQSRDDSRTLENIEDRLHALRTLARKHFCQVEGLSDLYKNLNREWEELDQDHDLIQKLILNVTKIKDTYKQKAKALQDARYKSALTLETAILSELSPLKLEKASLKVHFTELPENEWTKDGIDRLEFQIQTNPGMPFGSLAKVASGGERSRIMLALKVILAQESSVALLIFDEIDQGVGGAVASAIGERLARLGRYIQLLAVTHSPQVAAYAQYHWHVSKQIKNQQTITQVKPLNMQEKEEEIARMLAGELITDEARAAARQLIQAGRKK